jgi:hypothetical protein
MFRNFLMSAVTAIVVPSTSIAGSLQPLVRPAPEGVELAFLQTDGRVLAQSFTDQHFYALTPDNTGSYVNGTWSRVADLPRSYAPYAGASAVLADGRVLLIGGEYNFGQFDLTNRGAIYNPTTNKWKTLQPPPGRDWNFIGDSPALVLADGRFLIGDKLNKEVAAYDPKTGQWTTQAHTGKSDFNAEEGWTLLPDGKVLTYDVKHAPNSEIYDPARQAWTSAGNTAVNLAQSYHIKIEYGRHKFYFAPGEVGPGMLLPNGRVFATGSIPAQETSAHTAIYDSGTWTAGPDIPNGDDAADTGSILLPSGNVMQPMLSGSVYEFDGQNFIDEQINLGPNLASLLLLPTGQVLIAGNEVYNSEGQPDPSWAPTIGTFPHKVVRGSSYQISGTQFNGLSQANSFGDEFETATNYPLVRITNNATGHVFYARTHDHSTMGVATGNTVVSTTFDVPATMETGPSALSVVANGIASTPVLIKVR